MNSLIGEEVYLTYQCGSHIKDIYGTVEKIADGFIVLDEVRDCERYTKYINRSMIVSISIHVGTVGYY